MNLALDTWIGRCFRPTAARAGQAGRRTEQAADQRALVIDFTALWTEMNTAPVGESDFMLCIALDR